jgi:hypothetical protein
VLLNSQGGFHIPCFFLASFFNALTANGLAINLEKCVFAMPSLEILGHTISAARAAPTTGHATEIELRPPLRTLNNCNIFLAW